jgi:hypothetical protein
MLEIPREVEAAHREESCTTFQRSYHVSLVVWAVCAPPAPTAETAWPLNDQPHSHGRLARLNRAECVAHDGYEREPYRDERNNAAMK